MGTEVWGGWSRIQGPAAGRWQVGCGNPDSEGELLSVGRAAECGERASRAWVRPGDSALVGAGVAGQAGSGVLGCVGARTELRAELQHLGQRRARWGGGGGSPVTRRTVVFVVSAGPLATPGGAETCCGGALRMC